MLFFLNSVKEDPRVRILVSSHRSTRIHSTLPPFGSRLSNVKRPRKNTLSTPQTSQAMLHIAIWCCQNVANKFKDLLLSLSVKEEMPPLERPQAKISRCVTRPALHIARGNLVVLFATNAEQRACQCRIVVRLVSVGLEGAVRADMIVIEARKRRQRNSCSKCVCDYRAGAQTAIYPLCTPRYDAAT